jgi:hypothetical protein
LVVNNTPYTMTYFYASNVDRQVWEEDVLGSHVLEPGQEVNVDIDDGTGYCRFDLKAVFDGIEAPVVRHNLDVCSTLSWTINDTEQ